MLGEGTRGHGMVMFYFCDADLFLCFFQGGHEIALLFPISAFRSMLFNESLGLPRVIGINLLQHGFQARMIVEENGSPVFYN